MQNVSWVYVMLPVFTLKNTCTNQRITDNLSSNRWTSARELS